MERIDKIISSQGKYSRSEIKKLASQGRIKINDNIVKKVNEKIDIETYTDSEKAKVAIYGNENLKEGKNTIEIVVTAEAGNQKTYYI